MRLKKRKSEKRPTAITIVGLIAAIAAFVYFLRSFILLESLGLFEKGFSGQVFQGYFLTDAGVQWAIGWYYLTVSIAAYVIAIGLLKVRRWSWIAFMMWAGFNMVVGLYRHFYGASISNYLYLFLSVVVAFTLNQAEVQRVFGVCVEEGEEIEDDE